MVGIVIIILISLFIIGEILVRLLVPSPNEALKFFDNKNKMSKGRSGIAGNYKFKNSKGFFRLNNEGWNSTRDYFKEKKTDTCRIACIGESDTQALKIHVKDAYPKVIENTLFLNGIVSEVYTFAIDSVSAAHALHIARYILKNHNPDIITISDPAGEILHGIAAQREYMSISVENFGEVKEILPSNPIFKNILSHSKFIKFLIWKLDFRERFKKFTRTIKFSKNGIEQNNNESGIQDSTVQDVMYNGKYDIAIRHVYSQFRKIQQEQNVRILFLLNPWHEDAFNWHFASSKWQFASFNGSNLSFKTQSRKEEERKKLYIKSLLDEYSLSYFDLTDAFARDYRINRKKFDFLSDPHINEHGHKVEGEAVAEFLIENKYFGANPEPVNQKK